MSAGGRIKPRIVHQKAILSTIPFIFDSRERIFFKIWRYNLEIRERIVGNELFPVRKKEIEGEVEEKRRLYIWISIRGA